MVAVDRAVRAIQDHGLVGPLARWRALQDTIYMNGRFDALVERGAPAG